MKTKGFFIVLISLYAAFPLVAHAATGGPAFTKQSATADAGYYKLQWSGPEDSVYEIQRSAQQDFTAAKIIYQGTDTSLFLSGMDNSVTYYRVRLKGQDWSAPLVLTVKHHSLGKALFFLACGLIVFLLTVAVILKGHFEKREGQDA